MNRISFLNRGYAFKGLLAVSHTLPQAFAIASELAISLRRWSNIDNWHAECVDKSSHIFTSVFNSVVIFFIYLFIYYFIFQD